VNPRQSRRPARRQAPQGHIRAAHSSTRAVIWGVVSLVVLVCIMCGALTLAKMSVPNDADAAQQPAAAPGALPSPAAD